MGSYQRLPTKLGVALMHFYGFVIGRFSAKLNLRFPRRWADAGAFEPRAATMLLATGTAPASAGFPSDRAWVVDVWDSPCPVGLASGPRPLPAPAFISRVEKGHCRGMARIGRGEEHPAGRRTTGHLDPARLYDRPVTSALGLLFGVQPGVS